jgi:peroxiredoxin
MIIRYLLVCILALASSSLAATLKLDSLTVGATTYSNVTVLGANTTDLYFTHEHGIANVKLKYLPADLQKKFGFDAKAAAEAERKQLEEDSRYQKAVATTVAVQAQKKARAAAQSALASDENLVDPVAESSLIGKPAPAIKVEKWLTDQPVIEGKCALISFWTPSSVPCLKSIPELNALQKKFGEKMTIIGVSLDPEDKVNELTEPKITFPLAVDSKHKLSTAAGVTSVPYVLLLDAKGIVRYQGHPAAVTEARLLSLLAKTAE